MKKTYLAALALGAMTTAALAQADRLAIQSQPARDGNIAWTLAPSFPDSGGFTNVEPDGTVNVIPRPPRAIRAGTTVTANPDFCSHSPMCGRKHGFERGKLARVLWKQNMGYKFTYPYVVPKGPGGVPSVALDSKGNLWVFKRSPAGVVAADEVRPRPQADHPRAGKRDRPPGQGAWHGGGCRGQCLDLR